MNGDDKSGAGYLDCEEIKVAENRFVGVIRMQKTPRNSIGSWLLDAIYEKIDEYENNEKIRAIIIASKLRSVFSDGADRNELFGDWISGLVSESNYDRFKRAHRMYVEIENCQKPIIAAINGVTIGAGLELAMLCDFRVSSELAFFSLPEAKPELAIIPGLGGTVRLTRLVGPARAKEMLLLGKMIRAPKALEWGLITSLAPHREVFEHALDLAKDLAANDQRAMMDMKKSINYAADHDIKEGIEFEVTLFSEIMKKKLAAKAGAEEK